MKIAVMGCVHEKHNLLNSWVTDHIGNIDLIIVTGDVANSRVPSMNLNPMLDFLTWINTWDKPVLFVPGNHGTSIEAGMVNFKDYLNITPLIHESYTLHDVNFFGSPYTPSFGQGWAYNVKRSKIDKYWKDIPSNTDILITHGPPMHILDATEDAPGYVKHVGCKALLNHVRRVKPLYHVFSHLHDEKGALNNGTKTIGNLRTTFINCSIVNLSHKVVNTPKIIEM